MKYAFTGGMILDGTKDMPVSYTHLGGVKLGGGDAELRYDVKCRGIFFGVILAFLRGKCHCLCQSVACLAGILKIVGCAAHAHGRRAAYVGAVCKRKLNADHFAVLYIVAVSYTHLNSQCI